MSESRLIVLCPWLVLVMALSGCQGNHQGVDERAYVVGGSQAQWARARDYLDHGEYKEALSQLLAINTVALSQEEGRRVRDEVVRLYDRNRDYEAMIEYLEARNHLKGISASERAQNLFDEAEAYHHLSYNHWAYVLGMGSPYRQSKAAFKAHELYERFIKRYPADPKVVEARDACQRLEAYKAYYQKELSRHQPRAVPRQTTATQQESSR